jgi:hypothetical protein
MVQAGLLPVVDVDDLVAGPGGVRVVAADGPRQVHRLAFDGCYLKLKVIIICAKVAGSESEQGRGTRTRTGTALRPLRRRGGARGRRVAAVCMRQLAGALRGGRSRTEVPPLQTTGPGLAPRREGFDGTPVKTA